MVEPVVHPARQFWARPALRLPPAAPTTIATVPAGAATGVGSATGARPNVSAAARVATGVGSAISPARPTGFTHVIVTRDYDLATGSAPTGTVSFTPSTWLVNNGVTVVAATIVAPLNTDGKISVSLVSNTDLATTPAGSYYTVLEDIAGQPKHRYRITIPSDTEGFTVDVAYLENPTTESGYGLGNYGISGYGV